MNSNGESLQIALFPNCTYFHVCYHFLSYSFDMQKDALMHLQSCELTVHVAAKKLSFFSFKCLRTHSCFELVCCISEQFVSESLLAFATVYPSVLACIFVQAHVNLHNCDHLRMTLLPKMGKLNSPMPFFFV